MNFICYKENLIKSLNIVSKAVSSRTTLPILKGILITADLEKNEIKLSSSDLEISIETTLSGEIEEAGSIVISAKLFSEIVRKLPTERISIERKDGDFVEIKSGSSEFVIQGILADEFPHIEKGESGTEFVLNKGMLKDLIKSSSFAASIEESRGIITGVLLEILRKSVSMVALDGYRMAIVKENITSEEEKSVVISARVLNEIGKILTEDTEEEDIIIRAEEKKAAFLTKTSKIIVRLLDGDFIKYKEILPKEAKTSVVIDRLALLESVERASIIVREGKNSFIKFALENEQIEISSRSEEGTIRESIPVQVEGEGLEIGFNARFINDTLKAIKDEKIVMDFNTSVSPCIIKPLEGENFVYLILPVRLSSGNI